MSDFSVNNFESSGVSINSVFGIVDGLPAYSKVSFESSDGASFTDVEIGKGFGEVIEEVLEKVKYSLGGRSINEFGV